MEILRFFALVQFPHRLRDKVEHRLIRHRVAQHVIEHFTQEKCNSAFGWIRVEGMRVQGHRLFERRRFGGRLICGDLQQREGRVHPDGMSASQTIHHIINAPARTRVGVQHVRFVRMRLKRQHYRISRA